MGRLSGPLLQAGVRQQAVWVVVPVRVETGFQILILQPFESLHVEQPGFANIVAQYAAVPVFLGGPEKIPA